jgi:hypothetical protein
LVKLPIIEVTGQYPQDPDFVRLIESRRTTPQQRAKIKQEIKQEIDKSRKRVPRINVRQDVGSLGQGC